MSSTKHKSNIYNYIELSVKDHPFLREAQQQNSAKLSQFLERINGSKLSTDEKKAKKDIEQSKATFVKMDKGVEVKMNDQPRRYLPKIVDLNETKKEKKAQKIARKQGERQSLVSNTINGVPVGLEPRSDKETHQKSRPLLKPRVYDDELDEERLDDQDQEAQYEEDQDPEAKKELAMMLGKFRSSKYRDRDNEQIIESRQADIEREEKFSKMMAMKQDMEQQMILKRERERKLLRKKKLRRLEQVQGDSDNSDEKSEEEPRMRMKDRMKATQQRNQSDSQGDN